MRKNPLNQGIIMENAAGIGTVTTKMVEARARELARINGCGSKPTEADYQQAKRELTGESEIDPQEENLESLPESEGWDAVPGSTGRQAAEALGEDEDAEGRSESAQMFMTTPPSTRQEVTELLVDWSSGDTGALNKLIPLVQPELHRLAHYYMSREGEGRTLQTTALVNEAYLQFVDKTHPRWQNRPHFFAVAGQLMRRIMVDHARQRHALKRGGAAQKVTLDEAALVTETRSEELLALDEALENLAAFDPRMSKIVEMRYFGGLSTEEIAEVLKIHPNTVMRDWSAAKAWLYAALSGEEC
jgi:RNA polymerase sigma factor (TIGR02999 family)